MLSVCDIIVEEAVLSCVTVDVNHQSSEIEDARLRHCEVCQ